MKRSLVVALVLALALSMLALPAAAECNGGGGCGSEGRTNEGMQLDTAFLSGLVIDASQGPRLDTILYSFKDVGGIMTVQMSSGNGNIVQSNARVFVQGGPEVDLAATTAVYSGGIDLDVPSLGLDLTIGPLVVDASQARRADLIKGSFIDACGIVTVQMAAGNANTLQSIVNVKVAL